MSKGKAFLIDVGIQDFVFPIKACSRRIEDGQSTIATISIKARIMAEFEAEWIDRFIHIAHRHRTTIGTSSLKDNIKDYIEALRANSVVVEMAYPFFVEKITPASKEPCLVKYNCKYIGRYPALNKKIKILFGVECPIITTYPVGKHSDDKDVFLPQLSKISLKLEPENDIYPEDIIDLVDKHSLSPIYSFLTKEDQLHVIEKIHSNYHSSIDATDGIRRELARDPEIKWFSMDCFNQGMLHSYSTMISTEKSQWVPGSYFDMDDI